MFLQWLITIVTNVTISFIVVYLWDENTRNDLKFIMNIRMKKINENITLMDDKLYEFRERYNLINKSYVTRFEEYDSLIREIMTNQESIISYIEMFEDTTIVRKKDLTIINGHVSDLEKDFVILEDEMNDIKINIKNLQEIVANTAAKQFIQNTGLTNANKKYLIRDRYHNNYDYDYSISFDDNFEKNEIEII